VEARGEIENEEGVLVIKRIRVHYRLPVPEDKRADAERAHAVHQRACPVARSIGGAVDIETELELI
jgi:organic hydroperoxide reductase OsmC/OhrA